MVKEKNKYYNPDISESLDELKEMNFFLLFFYPPVYGDYRFYQNAVG